MKLYRIVSITRLSKGRYYSCSPYTRLYNSKLEAMKKARDLATNFLNLGGIKVIEIDPSASAEYVLNVVGKNSDLVADIKVYPIETTENGYRYRDTDIIQDNSTLYHIEVFGMKLLSTDLSLPEALMFVDSALYGLELQQRIKVRDLEYACKISV